MPDEDERAGFYELIRRCLGKRPGEPISREEIAALREAIEQDLDEARGGDAPRRHGIN